MAAESTSTVDASQAAGATGVMADKEYRYGTESGRSFDQDIHVDERYKSMGADNADAWRVNGKRTYDLHQTLDTDAILQARKQAAKLDSIELAEREQRIRHIEAEFNQRMRHADMTNAVTAALLGDMAEKLGEVYAKVVKNG